MPNQTNAAIPATTSEINLDPPCPTNSSTQSEKNQDNRSVYHDIDNGSPTRHKCENKSGGKLHAKNLIKSMRSWNKIVLSDFQESKSMFIHPR